ncbi:NAD(P)/FAD-dependent oxidoreductase [Nesterenkonia alba]|uniref:NAD(P)/FAD-dependent oxidoreductase n=1 Tax=Nesterenkonia alba TaxID=515814 RepID=UPI0003F98803|nr:FAD-dependent oxidoreductase [Nesterenkonia alba]
MTVIGAGIAGAATAFALARRGTEVTVVDDAAEGQATAASAGIISPWISAVEGAFYELYAAGGGYYPTLLEQLDAAGISHTDYRRTGSLIVHRDPGVLDEAEARVRARAARAGDVAGEVQRIGNSDARELFPALAEDLSAVYLSGGGRVDGRTLRDALLTAATTYGARRIYGHARLSAQVGTVEVNDEKYAADDVVVASGAWSAPLLADRGVTLPVAPQRGQITHLRLEGVDTSMWPTVSPLAHHYVVAFDRGRIAVGATRESGVGFDPRVTAAGQLQVLQDALSVVPGVAEATLIETRVGLRPLGTMPVVGQVGDDRLWVATGYGAAGLTIAPLLGDALARAIRGEPAPELDGLTPAAGTVNE